MRAVITARPFTPMWVVLLKIGIAFGLVLAISGLDWLWHGGEAGFHTLTLLTTGFGIGFLLKRFA